MTNAGILSSLPVKVLDDIILLSAIALSCGKADELPPARKIADLCNRAKEIKQVEALKYGDEPQETFI